MSKSTRAWKVGYCSSLQGAGAEEEEEEYWEMEEEMEDFSAGDLEGAGEGLERTIWGERSLEGSSEDLNLGIAAAKLGLGGQVGGCVEFLLCLGWGGSGTGRDWRFKGSFVGVGCNEGEWGKGMGVTEGISELWTEGVSVTMGWAMSWWGERSGGSRELHVVSSHLCQKGSFSSVSLIAGLGEYKRSSRSLR